MTEILNALGLDPASLPLWFLTILIAIWILPKALEGLSPFIPAIQKRLDAQQARTDKKLEAQLQEEAKLLDAKLKGLTDLQVVEAQRERSRINASEFEQKQEYEILMRSLDMVKDVIANLWKIIERMEGEVQDIKSYNQTIAAQLSRDSTLITAMNASITKISDDLIEVENSNKIWMTLNTNIVAIQDALRELQAIVYDEDKLSRVKKNE